MSLILKVPGVTFPGDLPKLYPDAAMTSGSKFCYDALDLVSWPSQAVPAGSPWVNLVDGEGDGVISGALGFDGGFVFDTDADFITLPASGKLAAD